MAVVSVRELDQAVPYYRILSTFYGPDSHLYGEGEVIRFVGEPNTEMEPLTQAARDAQQRFFDKLDRCAQKVAERSGAEYVNRSPTLEDAIILANHDSRRLSTGPNDGGIPLMAGKPKTMDDVNKVEFIQEPAVNSRIPDADRPVTQKGRGALAVSLPKGTVLPPRS